MGRWRIVEMDKCDRETLDLVEPAYFEFGRDGRGSFAFIAVVGNMDCRHAEVDGRFRVDFTWEGFEEFDACSGRGWAELEPDGSLRGHVFIHGGEDSAFRAASA